MKWIDHVNYIKISPPNDFSFPACINFFHRTDQEILYRIKDDTLYKLFKIEEQPILCKISEQATMIKIDFPIYQPTANEKEKIVQYLVEWFDLSRDLQSFYEMAEQDKILQPIVEKYRGLRLIGIPCLFEALVWAIIGQQINLSFAYTLKQRFVETFGEQLYVEGESYWLFPTPAKIAEMQVEDLRMLQFSERKAEYTIAIAKSIVNGDLTKKLLRQQGDYSAIKKYLMTIRGIGAWTADYVLMRCLQEPSAFPLADVGLHNALKIQLSLAQKPTIEEINDYAKQWEGWQAYATFYLWRSLYEAI
ncbi:DNA-3-methyladenine glycosylase 2 family protein [Lysinibacillus macroides]|uniref:DNA-3-methyladenine glycosylase II n=1 Tax=Lysinibacillus macroides TaxID=33935 RepID=A0A0M9DLZ8_9BACI|nr:DNA-3-methyladenine glycosylase [Lysinibacillus macroides]KOY83120.1 DNA-3-methyladenine glycosylase [Lysinibacillus macroides]QPR70020.1 DNA-3-methyladenine glycosylase 2 family protein [Lysinibacillus macroides]